MWHHHVDHPQVTIKMMGWSGKTITGVVYGIWVCRIIGIDGGENHGETTIIWTKCESVVVRPWVRTRAAETCTLNAKPGLWMIVDH